MSTQKVRPKSKILQAIEQRSNTVQMLVLLLALAGAWGILLGLFAGRGTLAMAWPELGRRLAATIRTLKERGFAGPFIDAYGHTGGFATVAVLAVVTLGIALVGLKQIKSSTTKAVQA